MIQARKFKSPLRVVVGFLLRSRETLAAKCKQLAQTVRQLKWQRDQQAQQIQQQQQEIQQLRCQLQRQDIQRAEWARQPPALPDDPPVGTHGYGPRMVSLATQLAKAVGLRGSERVLEIVFEWLSLPQKTPDWSTIRTWLMRLGVAALEEPVEPADDWIWMADHSNQIGAEKVLVILGVRASKLPPPGTALKPEDVRVLLVQPKTSWKTEDMAEAYNTLAQKIGPPRAIVVDGAVELRDGALGLKTQRPDLIVLRDFKHFAANVLKSLVGNLPRFQEFHSQAGRTRSAIQQTELGHLTPPSPKPKSRFMNLASTLRWASVVSWLLGHPDAESRQELRADRVEDKLGWLREFAGELAAWQECQNVISMSLSFLNEHGLFRGVSTCLRSLITESLSHSLSRQLAGRLIAFVQEAEEQLLENERLPISTEILESSFGLYKQLERQHSKGGFTSLLAAFGSLLQPITPERVTAAFSRVANKDVKTWITKHLGKTLTSRRRSAYSEYEASTKGATKQLTTA